MCVCLPMYENETSEDREAIPVHTMWVDSAV